MAYIERDFPIEQVNPLAQREANAKRPIYMLHKWWARRLGCVFRTIVLSALIPEEEWRRLDAIARKQGATAWDWLYYRQCHKGFHDGNHTGHGCAVELIDRYLKDKIVLDPFMGGGTTVVEALRLGCRVIGVDVNPVAWFVVKKSIEPVDLEKLDAAFQRLEAEVAPDILKFYRTVCPAQTSEVSQTSEVYHLADVMYVFWVKTVRCSSCGQKTRLFNSFRLATKNGQDAVVCSACYGVHWVDEGSEWVVCPDCGHAFAPRQGFSSGGRFTCEHCGQQDETVAWVRRTGKAPGYEMFATEYYCPTCEEAYVAQGYKRRQAQQMARGYKGAEEADRQLYRQACREFEEERATLPLPEGDIPAEGRSDPRPISFGLRRWTDLFNPRQLLCLGRLLRAIRQIEDRAVREILVVTLSDAVNANNMLCQYHATRFCIGRLFGHHAFWVPDVPCENNPWGARYGTSSFTSCFDKTLRAIAWLTQPAEPMDNIRVALGDSPMTAVTNDAMAAISGTIGTRQLTDAKCAMFARTAEDLSFLPSRSVNAVITDPPYYGNVQYAELSDFFYVWLRLGLPDYPEFAPPLVPKAREIVVNEKAKVDGGVKDDAFFRRGLLRCFGEGHRVLKDDGPLIFTFHHESPQAWGAVLEAVLEAGFDVRAVWTYHSESAQSIHRHGIRFDTVIVCRKRAAEPAAVAWRTLQDEIAAEVQQELRRLLDNGATLGLEDIFVITMGKALAVYSRHHPRVMHEGGAVQVPQAIEDIEKLVDEQIDAYFGMVVPGWLDALSRVYLQSLAHRQTVSRDSLVKTCRTRGLEFSELEEAQFIRRSKGQAGLYEVLRPTARAAYLEKRLEAPSPDLSPVDRAHWLYLTYQRHRSLREAIPQVYQRGLEEVCTALHRITRDGAYERLAQEIDRLKGQGVLL